MINEILSIKHKHPWIILSFLALSIISIYLMVISSRADLFGDASFHLQRIMEVKNSIQHLTLPKVALNRFNYNGSAVMTMYPYITLIPFAIAAMFIKSIITLIYFMAAFYAFITMIISFYSSRSITNNDLTSYLFAITYGMIGNFELIDNDFGVNIVIVVLPLVIFGMISFIKYNKWIELSTGMSLILLSNLIAFIIITAFFILFIIINYKKITKNKVKSLIKATLLSLSTTAIFLIPFFKMLLLNDLQIPKTFILPNNTFDKIQSSLSLQQYVSNNVLKMDINYIGILTILLGLFFIPKIKGITRQFYWIGSLSFLIYSSPFIWKFVNNSPLHSIASIIQFPDRFYFISQILLNFVFAILITQYINYGNKKQLFKTVILISVFIVLSQMSMQWLFCNENLSNATDRVITKQNEEQYKNISFDEHNDYYPINSLPMTKNLQTNQAIYKKHNKIKVQPNGQGKISFNVPVKNIAKLKLPFLYYNGIKYQIKMDGKDIPFKNNKQSLMTINNIPRGNHNIKISVKNSWDYIFGSIMFIISLIIYCLLFIKYLSNNYKIR